MISNSDTIIAIASPAGRSLRGIVRLSGADAIRLAAVSCNVHEDHLMNRGVRAARVQASGHQVAALLTVAIAPRSYTGEHSCEIQAAGNPALLERIVDSLLDKAVRHAIGARRAEAGEFTARAFLNGRISLTQAEGVQATIAARSDAELRAAALLTQGRLGAFARTLADDLAAALALVEAGIDFTDQDDVVAVAPADLLDRLERMRQSVEAQLARAVGFEQLEAIPWVVLTGEPNAGKSALFNALLERERSVVSSISGTTRDVLAEPLTVPTDHGPAEVMLVDVAGQDSRDASCMNALMQDAAAEAIQRAELLLHCAPAGEPALRARDSDVLVRTKCDAGSLVGERGDAVVSAVSGEGLRELRQLIGERLSASAVSLAADAVALRPRHEGSLRSAQAHLDTARDVLARQTQMRSLDQPELLASCMRSALNDLAALAGDITPDEVLGRIFASFCIGK